MEQARPRAGSICLPTGHERLRLVLVPVALAAGGWAGWETASSTGVVAEAIVAGVLVTDIALHVGELVVHALAFSRWAWVVALELMVGMVAGLIFFEAFEETAEAVAIGLMAANIALHLTEVVIETLLAKRSKKSFGGLAPSAGATS